MTISAQRSRATSTLRIGSRGSALALWQAEHARARIQEIDPGCTVEIIVIQTTGDRITDVPLSRIGDKGLFTKELDLAILDDRIDLAVHSLKDIPTRLTDGLALAAVLERADPRDALVVAPHRPTRLQDLPAGARIGTSSLRRRAQLLALRPDFRVEDLRGNLDTRLARVAAEKYDAVILALAGLQRLGFSERVAETLDPPQWLPAAGQGALGITTRADDISTRTLLEPLDHLPTRAATDAERSFLHALEGGCQVPIGVLGTGLDTFELHGLVAAMDGAQVVRGRQSGAMQDAANVGYRLAQELLAHGAAQILAGIRDTPIPDPAAP